MTKRGNKSLDRLFETTEEQKAEYARNRKLHKESLTLAYQLGMYVGEHIVHNMLPTLSVDSIHTTKNISVTCGEGDKHRRLNELWFNKSHSNEPSESEWDALRAHHVMLEAKYLPERLECYVAPLNVSAADMPEFKRGLGVTLWDCDCSHYSPDPERIAVEDCYEGFFTVITLERT